MQQRSARVLPMEVFHRLDLTGDQMNTVYWALAQLKGSIEEHRSTDPLDAEILKQIDEVVLQMDSSEGRMM